MAWNDPGETVVAGNGEAYVAPVGTALPATATTALNSAFSGLGYHTEDGVSYNRELNVTEFPAWQSHDAIRRERDTSPFTITFALLQFLNEINIPFVFGGGSISTVGTNLYKYSPPADSDALDEKSLIVDVDDGPARIRFVIPRGTVTDAVSSQFARNQMSALPVAFKALKPDDGGLSWYPLFYDPDGGLAAGS